MHRYVVNRIAQPGGDHEVHREGCHYWPLMYVDLGQHAGCSSAVVEARKHYRQANGCAFGSRECHTR